MSSGSENLPVSSKVFRFELEAVGDVVMSTSGNTLDMAMGSGEKKGIDLVERSRLKNHDIMAVK